MTTPARVILTASGGVPRDFTSTKCSFFNSLTFAKVAARELFASATAASAFSASSRASLSCFLAMASSFATVCYVRSASFYSTAKCSIIFSVWADAISSSGLILVSVTFISSTALFAPANLSKPLLSLRIYSDNPLFLVSRIVLYRFNNSKKLVGVT